MNDLIKILYIDDNPHDQELVIDSLEKENKGFQVTLASNSVEFERHLEEKKFDLVLSDFNILGYEGLSVLTTVQKCDSNIPVIIVTGTGSEEIAVEAMKRGADDYVIKSPSHIRHLPLTIQTVIEKKQLELQNRKAQEELVKLRKAVENSGEIIFMTNIDGIFTFVNPEFTSIYGYSQEEVVGKYSPNILTDTSTPRDNFENISKQLLNGTVVKGETINKTKAGVSLKIEFSFSPVFDNNKQIKNFLAIQRDITERKNSEEQLKKQYIELEIAKANAEKADKIKTEFLAQVSHEIRTPINNILNYTSLLKSDIYNQLDEETQYSFEAVERASHRLIRTIDLILNMSELQTESYYPYFKEIDILNILEQQVEDFSLAANKKKLNLILDKSGCGSNCLIFGDEYTVIQILQNLIDNAIKYTEKGNVETKLINYDDHLDISITDTGIGISEEFIPKLFTPFSQEYSGYTRLYDGNGLGLAIVKKYIEINHGKIDIRSTKGEGTTVIVTFNKNPFLI